LARPIAQQFAFWARLMPNQQQYVGAQAPHALLPRWANDKDGWSRAIAGDVLKNGAQQSDLDIDRHLRLLLSEKKLSPEPFEAVPKIEEKQLAGNPLDPVRLDSLKVGDGVKLQESMAAIVPVFEKWCRYVASHSQPLETQGIRPTLDELKADYDTVLKAREPHKG